MSSDTPYVGFELRHRLEAGSRNDIATKAVRSASGVALQSKINRLRDVLRGAEVRINLTLSDADRAALDQQLGQALQKEFA